MNKTHYRNTPLFVNAGLHFPECYAHCDLLDLDKGALPTTGKKADVTCLNCQKFMGNGKRKPNGK